MGMVAEGPTGVPGVHGSARALINKTHVRWELMLLPNILGATVSGIPKIARLSLHYDRASQEYYYCTDGSNFVALYTCDQTIPRFRCLHTPMFRIITSRVNLGNLGLRDWLNSATGSLSIIRAVSQPH